MRVATYEAVVENGQIVLSDAVRLPEYARVYVVVAGVEEASGFHARSPRLGRPEQAGDFLKEVVAEPEDAGLR